MKGTPEMESKSCLYLTIFWLTIMTRSVLAEWAVR